MSSEYQPRLIQYLALTGGSASEDVLAAALGITVATLRKYPIEVLCRHGVVERTIKLGRNVRGTSKEYGVRLLCERSQYEEINAACIAALQEYAAKKGKK